MYKESVMSYDNNPSGLLNLKSVASALGVSTKKYTYKERLFEVTEINNKTLLFVNNGGDNTVQVAGKVRSFIYNNPVFGPAKLITRTLTGSYYLLGNSN